MADNAAAANGSSPSPIEITLDATDCIIAIRGPWDDFATDNGAPDLLAEKVLGISLFDAVSGKVTQRYLAELLRRARANGRSESYCYRCDSPTVAREMQLDILPMESGHVRMTHHLLSESPHPFPVACVRAHERSRDTLVRCSACNRVSYGGAWREVGDVGKQSGKALLMVIYGICPACD